MSTTGSLTSTVTKWSNTSFGKPLPLLQLRPDVATYVKSAGKGDPAREAKLVHNESDLESGETTSAINKTVDSIMDILESFSRKQKGNTVFVGREVFSPRVRRHVAARRTIPMVLPAFPAKSINRVDKVLGPSPDLGEELALARLNDLCCQIQEIYTPGAMVLIATDGACYNDLTGVTNHNLWEYGVTIRKMVAAKGYKCIEFVRIMNLLGLHAEPEITKEQYIALLEPSRQQLMERYGDPHFDANACIKSDPDYKLTFDGYAKFLKKDLAYGPIRDAALTSKKYKSKVHETAKIMIARGVAFAKLILEKYPEYVRLSIHPSTGLTKISMPLIPQPDSFSMTPWHCAVAVDVHGNFKTGHITTWKDTHDIVYRDGRPYFFREKSPLYKWDAQVDFEHLYGGGIIVHNKGGETQTRSAFSDSDKMKAATLAILQGNLTFKGFL